MANGFVCQSTQIRQVKMSHERQIEPRVDVRWGSDGGKVFKCIVHLRGWGYLWWHHCRWANSRKCGVRDIVYGRDTAPMCDRCDSVSRSTIAPMCGKRDSLSGKYGWR